MLSDVQSAIEGRPADTVFVLLLDFDGTLAEFNPDPGAPELTPERYELLIRISRQPGVSLGIVSGRRLDDLRSRTRLPDYVYHAGLHGIEGKLEAPPPFVGDAYQAEDLPRIPGSLREATACLERSEAARSAFGDVVVEHYLNAARREQAIYDRAITCWELDRYFERI